MITDFTNGEIKCHQSILMHVDGGCEPVNPGGTACSAWVLYGTDKKILAQEHKVVQKGEKATNNFAEYCALGLGLRWLDEQKWRGELHVKADSKLLVEQVNRRWNCKAKNLVPLRDRIFELMQNLELKLCDPEVAEVGNFSLVWVPREQNSYADELTNIAYRDSK